MTAALSMIAAVALAVGLAAPARAARFVTLNGSGCASYGVKESPALGKARALVQAKQDALRRNKAQLAKQSGLDDFSLDEDLVATMASGYLRDVRVTDENEFARKVCVKVRVRVEMDEIDALVVNTLRQRRLITRIKLTGRWEAYQKPPSRGYVSLRDREVMATWGYSVPEVVNDTYTGVDCFVESVSVTGRTLLVDLESENGHPVIVRFFCHTPDFSIQGDDSTYVPVEATVPMEKGRQTLEINPEFLAIPDWWRQDNYAYNVSFNPEDVRIIEFDALVSADLGPIDDTIRFHSLVLEKR